MSSRITTRGHGRPRHLAILCANLCGLLHLWDGEDFGPERGKGMCITNLNYLDLTENTVVKGELLLSEANQNFVTKVDSQQIGQQ